MLGFAVVRPRGLPEAVVAVPAAGLAVALGMAAMSPGGPLRRGRPERTVVSACAGADLLVLARDGDRARLGPRSLGHATRFAVDHAPCRVLLVWPEASPSLATIPPPPPNHA